MLREFKEADGSSIYLKSIIGLIVINLAAGIVAAGVKASSGTDLLNNSTFNYIVMTLMQAAYLIITLRHLAKRGQRLTYSVRGKLWIPAIPICIGIGIITLFGFYGLAAAFSMLLEAINYSGSVNIPFNNAGEIVVGTLLTVIAAPICEELVYRGALLTGLRKARRWWSAMLFSGLAFSLMHMNPEQTVYQFCLGCVAAFAALTTGSLICPMIIHATSNLIAVLFETTSLGTGFTWFINAISVNGAVTALWIILSAVVALAAIFFIGVLLYRKRPPRIEPEYDANADLAMNGEGLLGKKSGKVYYFMALGICIFMWIAAFVQGMA